jgi:hypothetical protein
MKGKRWFEEIEEKEVIYKKWREKGNLKEPKRESKSERERRFEMNEGKEEIWRNGRERSDLPEVKGKRHFEGTKEKEVI